MVVIGFLTARKSVKFNYRTFHAWALFSIAAMLLVVMNILRIPDGYDVWQAKRRLAHARTSDQIHHVALESPSNKLIKLVLASNDAVQESSTATVQLIKDLEPKGITLNTMRAASTRDQLVESARELRAAATAAESTMTRYLAILESERSSISEAGRAIYPVDPLYVVPNFMGALARRQEISRERMNKTFMAIRTFYSAKRDVADFLVRNWDLARSPKERSTFADQATSDRYYKLSAAVRATQATMVELERDDLKFDADRRTLWNFEIGRPR